MVASRGDNFRPATRRGTRNKNGQVETVAWKLDSLLKQAAEHELGAELGDGMVRKARLAFLNTLFGSAEYRTIRYGGEIASAADLTFAEASALLDWAFTDRAEDDLALWLRDNVGELGIPYADMMF